LHALDTASFMGVYPGMELPGLARIEDSPLQAMQDTACWVATHAPGTEFAYAVCARVDEGVFIKYAQVPLTGVSQPLRIAPMPGGGGVAVAIENRLELWPQGQRDAKAEMYDAVINVLRWTPEGLFLGEGGRVHHVDPASRRPLSTIQLQTGLVTDITLIPAATLPLPDTNGAGLEKIDDVRGIASRFWSDTDKDGIPDVSDPEPTTSSPQLVLPGTVTFRGEAAGRELHTLVIDPPYGGNSSWHIDYDKTAMPWLVIHPTRGSSLPDVVYMGVDPVRYARGAALHGLLEVSVGGTRPGIAAAGSPAVVYVDVAPERGGVRRILWIRDGDPAGESLRDRHGLGPLADMLAGPPHHFTHREATGPFLEPLDAYNIVVLDAATAARGALTPQAVLDYVAGGGALLFLGAHLPSRENWALLRWLSPMGIQINTAVAIEGMFSTERTDGLCRHWRDVRIRGGCGLRADAEAILVSAEGNSEQAILAARTYGYGRAAVLAAPTPLESAAMQTTENRLFAEDLFRWLARAGREIEDMDGDGLTDDMEDRNKNGVWDAGETDYLNPDTDRDGIPDGMEDRNRNGLVDEGETDPRNPDSDGDGVFDGADARPLPPADAPQVAAVEPRQGPAEGGTPVLIIGRNLTPGTVFWFGERVARQVEHLDATRASALTPRYEGKPGDMIDVRARNSAGVLEGVLPNAFRYTARTAARLVARVQSTVQREPGVYEGSVTITLDCPQDVAMGRILVLINVEPAEGFQWGIPSVLPNATAMVRHVTWHQRRAGGVWINASGGHGGGELASIPWTLTVLPDQTEPVRLAIQRAHVAASNGTPLDVTTEDALVRLGTRIQRAHRASGPQ